MADLPLRESATATTDTRRDDRWRYGMNGWRVYVWEPKLHYGEVTGYSQDGNRMWVVLDGEEEPRIYDWSEVRPA